MKKKLCITYITTGKYKIFFDDFFKSFFANFCNNQERTFFIFTDDEELIKTKLESFKLPLDLVTIKFFDVDTIDDADYNKFRKFKILNSAEKYYSEFDYVFYFNGNLICRLPVDLKELFSDNKELFAVTHSLFDKTRNNMTSSLCQVKKSAAYFDYIEFKNTYKYFQSGCIGATSNRWQKMISFIESCRYYDDYYELSKYVPWHDETYYNKYINILLRQIPDKVNILDGKIYLCSWLNVLYSYVSKSKMLLICKEYCWKNNQS